MAPELARARPIDGRADLYAPAPPSRRAPGPVPPALDRLILDGLAKDPERRPASAAAMAAALAAIDGERWCEPQAAAWWRELSAAPERTDARDRAPTPA
jgi:serine/threonine-protein kinase